MFYFIHKVRSSYVCGVGALVTCLPLSSCISSSSQQSTTPQDLQVVSGMAGFLGSSNSTSNGSGGNTAATGIYGAMGGSTTTYGDGAGQAGTTVPSPMGGCGEVLSPIPPNITVANPVFRFYNAMTGTSFFTMNTPAAFSIQGNIAQDGGFYALIQPTSGYSMVPLQECQSTSTQKYYITNSLSCDGADKSVQFFGYACTSAGLANSPLYRFDDTTTGDSVVSTNPSPPEGYSRESAPLAYVVRNSIPSAITPPTQGVALHRFTNPSGSHYFATDPLDAYTKGYITAETGGFYVLSSTANTIPGEAVALYQCLGNSHYFLSTSSNCEGLGSRQSQLGYIDSTAQYGGSPLIRYTNAAGDFIETTYSIASYTHTSAGVTYTVAGDPDGAGYVQNATVGYIRVQLIQPLPNVSTAVVPVYRYFKKSIPDHFYTLSAQEANNAGYVTEDGGFYVFQTQWTGSLIQLYRCLTTTSTPQHFVSSDPACEGSTKESTYGYIFPSNAAPANTTPLARWNQVSTGDHLVETTFTIIQDPDSQGFAKGKGFTLDGTIGNFPAGDVGLQPIPPNYAPVYRYIFQSSAGPSHYYSLIYSVTSALGSSYNYEGVAFSVVTNGGGGAGQAPGANVPLYLCSNTSNTGQYPGTNCPGGTLIGYLYSSQVAGTAPLNQYWNSGGGDVLAAGADEGAFITTFSGTSYALVGPEGYAPGLTPFVNSSAPATEPIYRFNYVSGMLHHFLTNTAAQGLAGGYTNEGVMFSIVPSAGTPWTLPLYQCQVSDTNDTYASTVLSSPNTSPPLCEGDLNDGQVTDVATLGYVYVIPMSGTVLLNEYDSSADNLDGDILDAGPTEGQSIQSSLNYNLDGPIGYVTGTN